MNSMTEPTNLDDRINDKPSEIVADAMVALVADNPQTPELAEDLLRFWVRRSEMTDADVTEVCRRLFPKPPTDRPGIDIADVRQLARQVAAAGFAIDPDGDPTYLVGRINVLLAEGVTPTPPESEWVQPPACPAWCTGRHQGETFGEHYRDCESEEMFVPQYGNGVACVNVATTFDRATGRATPVLVRVEDMEFTPQYARHLAVLLVRAADLIDG